MRDEGGGKEIEVEHLSLAELRQEIFGMQDALLAEY